MAVLPLIMTRQGLMPRRPSDIRAEIVQRVGAIRPGYTDNLPGTLIEDIASTETAAVVESDQFLVDLVNSVSPNGANPFMLQQLGDVYDVQPKGSTNTSVYASFAGPPGFVVVQGFTVSDGTYDYVCQEGGIIGASGASLPLYAVAPMPGSWAVPAGTVNQLKTSVPSAILDAGFGVINLSDGLPATTGETIEQFRERVWTAGLASSTGMARLLKTYVWRVPGVVKRLVSVREDGESGRYVVLVGGGDPYQVAYAIWSALFWTSGLVAAPINIIGIAKSNPAVITTESNHNLADGMMEAINGVQATGPLANINGNRYPVTFISDTTFSVPFDASAVNSVYISGGEVTPNPIVEEVTVYDYPDRYVVTYVIPAAEITAIVCSWATNSPNYISDEGVASRAAQPILDYVNSIPCGLTPLSIYELERTFLDAVNPILPRETVTILKFAVSIDGVGVLPEPGTGVIPGDINGFFSLSASDLIILQGG